MASPLLYVPSSEVRSTSITRTLAGTLPPRALRTDQDPQLGTHEWSSPAP